MALLTSFAVLVFAAAAVPAVAQQGFLNIDCGLESGGYTDPQTGLYFVSDGPYVYGGEKRQVEEPSGWARNHQTLRSFPTGARNCYMLPAVAGKKYLLRAEFVYGDYDGRSRSWVLFDLYLGVNLWGVVDRIGQQENEAVFVAWASWVPVCLVRTSQSTPYVSSMQLIQLDREIYPIVNASGQFMSRYPVDIYDRFWWESGTNPMWANLSTTSTIKEEPVFTVPMPVLQTATAATGNTTNLTVATWSDVNFREHMVFLHFADFQNSQTRQFDAYLNDNRLTQNGTQHSYSPPYLSAACVFTSNWYRANNGEYSITLVSTAESKLPPMLNAFEIYTRILHDNPMTSPQDFDAIMAIKLEYGITKNWMGDPCFPMETTWDGVRCKNSSDNTFRIISMDLSYSNLKGAISYNFTLLTSLKDLNLSGNQLNGPIPDSLCESNKGSFVFSYKSNGETCNATLVTPSLSRKRSTTIVVSVTGPLLVLAIFTLAYLIWRSKRKPNISTHDPARHPRLKNDLPSRKYYDNHLKTSETRRFTYKELEKFTNKFQRFVGKGGFGPVYYGRLEDDTEVAVKIRSESASQGLDQFLAEVQNLTKVHHRNLVSLVGYCWEKDHLALVYEYMSQGNLRDHIRGENNVGETMNWATRVRILLEAGRGLNYLHSGCNLPIIHRDIKTNNILLGQNFHAKIADLGLSKSFLTDTQSHITIHAAGTIGYLDPLYYRTCRLTESSDVFSFGVVLLEVVTGESPILAEQDHIIQRVKHKIASGADISSVADVHLGGAYDISSMWKVVNTAMLCTVDVPSERPTMATVVAELKQSLELEEALADRLVTVTEDRYARVCPEGDSVASVSTFDFSAR